MSQEVRTYKIPSDNLSELTRKFQQLGRRAKRIGLPAHTFTETQEPERIQKTDELGNVIKTYLLHYIVVDAGCTEIKVQGWTFTATVQITEEDNIIRNVGQEEVPVQYRTMSNKCEHCNTIRNRKDVYVLRHEDGAYKVVGRNCLSDFFGHDALVYAERAQYLTDIASLGESMENEFGFGGRGGSSYSPLEIYLSYVAECVRLDGWMSRGKAREIGAEGMATCEIALKHLNPRMAGPQFRPMFTYPTEDSVNVAIQ